MDLGREEMVSTKTERVCVKQLKEAGERLVHPPSNVNELLSLLDLVECCLLRITQPPSKTIENALGPLKKALVAEDLLTHSDIDVKVSVAACISELARISAPAILYDDEQMRKVFRLIVDAFDGLSDTSSPSYSKRVSILESMARDPSCVVLPNLKCDAMILEMFQHFLKSIWDYHPKHVFSDMETIMTFVLKESDDVSFELLSLLIDSVRKKDEYVLPIRRKLAEKVVRNCVATEPMQMIHHESVIAAECNGANANASGERPANGSKSLEKDGADRIPKEANKVLLKVAGSGFLDDALAGSFQRVMTSGDTQIGSGDSLTYPSSPQKKPQCTDRDTDEAKTTDTAEKIEPHNLESKTIFIPETEPSQVIKKTREVQNQPKRSFDSSNNRELDAALECVEAEDDFALIEPWERREKTKAAYKADKNLYAFESWENRRKAAFEAELKKIEELPRRKKAEHVEKMKDEVALIHKAAEKKRAMIEAMNGEEILKAEEIAGKCQASEAAPMTLICLICLLFAFGGGLLFGHWISENIV